jgi:transcriptional regulator with XRE-family HTH domain
VTGPASERVAHNVWQIRAARGLTQRELSAKLQNLGRPISAGAISKIENGRPSVPEPKAVRRVDVDDLLALAAALAVPPARLWAETTTCHVCFGAPPFGFICGTCSAHSPYGTA